MARSGCSVPDDRVREPDPCSKSKGGGESRYSASSARVADTIEIYKRVQNSRSTKIFEVRPSCVYDGFAIAEPANRDTKTDRREGNMSVSYLAYTAWRLLSCIYVLCEKVLLLTTAQCNAMSFHRTTLAYT